MSVSPRVASHLRKSGVRYDLIAHPYALTSLSIARAANVPAEKVAKAVIVRDGDRDCMCVIPANHRLMLYWLDECLNGDFYLVSEAELAELFDDCEHGAVPVLGQVYGMQVVWDTALVLEDDLYFESGDHRHLVHLEREAITALVGKQRHELISTPDSHSSEWMIIH